MYRVMIVDDDAPFARSIEGFDWAQYGCKWVYTAANGRDALEKCARLMPHIVVTDINMPVMDGIELTRALREKYPEIRVILLTVHKEFAYARQAVGLGACDYLVKDMGYRAQLPAVLERAKRAFQDGDGLAAFLSRGGRLLTLSAEGLSAAEEALSAFLLTYGGALITARFDADALDRGALIQAIDQHMRDGFGWIVYENQCVELMGRDFASARAYWRTLSADPGLPFRDMRAAYSLNVATPAQYKKAHAENLMWTERGFYEGDMPLSPASDPHFKPLPAQKADAWAQQALAAAARDALEEFLQALRAEAARERYVPAQVRDALMEVMRQIELRWAEGTDASAQAAIRRALDLDGACGALLGRAAQLRASGDAMSYQCRKAVAFISEHLSDPELSLASVAESVFISPGYLSKRLKEETGCAFKELLIRLRMERAAELILAGRDKVYEIALKTGYQNYRSFAAAFEAHYGVSVKKYKGRVP